MELPAIAIVSQSAADVRLDIAIEPSGKLQQTIPSCPIDAMMKAFPTVEMCKHLELHSP
jgi:hypothetical protein